MKVPGSHYEQRYNAQALVATGNLLIVANAVTHAANDKEHVVPMIEKLQALPQELGRVRRLLADAGYLSEANVEPCEAAKIEPLIASKGQTLYLSCKQRLTLARKIAACLGHTIAANGAPVENAP